MRLFGVATSVAGIQLAWGFTGALYRPFLSKRAMLVEGVHRYVAVIEKSRGQLLVMALFGPEMTVVAPLNTLEHNSMTCKEQTA